MTHPQQNIPQFTLLYTDDDADNLLAFKAVFKRQYKVLCAANAKEAILLLETEPVDLLLTDNRMPGMTGIELLALVEERFPSVIRMLVTGYADMHTAIDAINKGKVYHFMLKPWDVEELKKTIAYALEGMRLRRENEMLLHEKQDWILRQAILEKANVLARFESLKNQLNPHFLFNSFNIIASLISIKPNEAIRYTQRFASLFRHMLSLHNASLIGLKEELEFVVEWLDLQQVRFGNNLRYEINIGAELMNHSLPPLAIHTLVENAVKHNEISTAQPLNISILSLGKELMVSNPIRLRKGGLDESTGLGLKNLKERYALLGSEPRIITDDPATFCVAIPLFSDNL